MSGGATPDSHEYKIGPFQRSWHRNDQYIDEEGHITDLITREAIKWLGERTEKPFFLYVPFTAVHVPIAEPEKWLAANSHISDPARRLHAADTSHMDDCVGQIVAAIEKKGVRDNTLVLFLSDNGAHTPADNKQDKYPGADRRPSLEVGGSNAPLRGWKSSVYEGGIRTPGFAHWPKHWQPRVIDQPLSITDWLPTLCKLAGAALPANLRGDGQDIAPLLAGTAPLEPHPIYSVSGGFKTRMVRSGDWKLIVIGEGGRRTRELYHVSEDIGETNDLAASQPDKVNELDALVARFAADDKPGKKAGKGD
jgi:arylsulfatase A-like enzyme